MKDFSQGLKQTHLCVFGKTSFSVFGEMVGRVVGETSLDAGKR